MQKTRVTLPTVVFSVIIVILTWSLVEGWFSLTQRKWLFMAAGMGYAVFLRTKFYGSNRFIWLVVYIAIVLLNMISGDRYFFDNGTVGFEFFVLGFPAVVTSYTFSSTNRKSMGFLLITFFIVLFFTTVASFLIDSFMLPNAIRMMTRYSITLNDMSSVYAFYKLGLSSYAFPHALPVLIPVAVMGIKNRNLPKKIHLLCWVALFCLILLVYLSGIMTALLLAIVGLLIAVVTKSGKTQHNLRRFVFVGIVAIPFFTPSIMGPILYNAKMAVGEDSYYYSKLESFEMSMVSGGAENGEGSDWEERQLLYSKSAGSLFENLLLGTNQKLGGHSSLLDRFATLGMIGFIPFIIFLIRQLRYPEKIIPSKSRIYYYEGLTLGLLMLALKSSFRPETLIVLFTILPIAVYYLSYEKSEA